MPPPWLRFFNSMPEAWLTDLTETQEKSSTKVPGLSGTFAGVQLARAKVGM
jgi:hypothetical protein